MADCSRLQDHEQISYLLHRLFACMQQSADLWLQVTGDNDLHWTTLAHSTLSARAALGQMLVNFENFFTVGLSKKFATKPLRLNEILFVEYH